MFSELTHAILEGIRNHGMLAVVIGVAIETIIVPLPSPLIVMTAGYVLIKPGSVLSVSLSALNIALVAGLAQTVGSYILYFLGYLGGKPLIDKYEKFHGVSWNEIKDFQRKFSKGGKEEFTLFLLRALPIMPLSIVSGVAGVVKMKFKNYTIATFLGTVPRNFILAISGFAFAEFYLILAKHMENAESVLTYMLVFMIILYVIGHKTGSIKKIRRHILR